jgi:hypothetical protein
MSKDFFKSEIVKIRLSESFMARARCKFCKGPPEFYYYLRNASMYIDVRSSNNVFQRWKKAISRFNRTNFNFDPKYMNGASFMSHPTSWTKYRPRLHRTRGTDPTFDIVEVVCCDCMRTQWCFSDKAIQDRPEINQRKSNKRFPVKFEF